MAKRRLSVREQKLFARYLETLESAGIPNLLLRNYIEFPEAMGNDVDLFVPRKDLARAEHLFRQALRECGGQLLMVNPRDYFLDLRFSLESTISDALELDLFHGAFSWHGHLYLKTETLLEGATRHPKGFHVPRPAHEALNLILASLLWGGFFKDRYRSRITELLAIPDEKREFDRCMEAAFGAGAELGFDPSGNEAPSKTAVQSSARRLRAALKWTSFRSDKTGTVIRWASHWLWELYTMLRPRGLQIAFLGPDGAGKSTVIEVIRERFSRIFVDTHLYHWRPSVLPEIGVLLRQRAERSGPVKQPHDKPAHSAGMSFIRLIYYLADYWIGFGPRIWKRRAQSNLVIFDRYADDMWCDPKRYRLGLPEALTRILCKFTPQPDFTFVLLADAETLARRKGELPTGAAEEMLGRYRRLGNSGGRHILVDATQPAEKVAAEIEKLLHSELLRREAQ